MTLHALKFAAMLVALTTAGEHGHTASPSGPGTAPPAAQQRSESTDGLALVVHKSSPFSTISIQQLRKLLLSQSEVIDGVRAPVIVQLKNPHGPLKAGLEYALKMSLQDYYRSRRAAEYRGKDVLPLLEFDTVEEICSFITGQPNAVALLESRVVAQFPSLKSVPILLKQNLLTGQK